MTDWKTCPDCDGSGKCPECKGEAFVQCVCEECGDIHDTYCGECEDGECFRCKTTGKVPVSDKEREDKGQLNFIRGQGR